MTFANPRAFSLLLLVLALAILSVAYGRWLKSRFEAWISPALWGRILPEYSGRVRTFRMVSLFAGLVLLCISIARPQWGQREETIQSRGMDILFLMDLSSSMLAEDTPPSRLARAQILIRNLLKNLGEDRVGIVSFAGKAFLTVPLTNDFDYVTEMSETLDPSVMASQGTDLGEAISVAMRAFERSGEDPHKQSRAVIVISDGEDFGGSALQAAAKLKDFGASFFALSVGGSEGAPIPLRGPTGILQTYKKDSAQKPVLTRVNRELLAKVAEAGGGTHLELINPDDAADALLKALKSAARSDSQSRLEIVKIDRFQIFLAAAVLCFLLHLSFGYRTPQGPLLLLLASVGLAGPEAWAQTIDSFLSARKGQQSFEKKDFEGAAAAYERAQKADRENPVLGFNQGTAIARTEKKDDARAVLQEASRKALIEGDLETAARSLYNEGVLLNESKTRSEAYDRLTKAIELAKRSGLSDVEEKARRALAQSFQQQQQQPKQNQDDSGGKSGQEPPPEQEPGKSPSNNPPPGPEEGRRRQFKSGTLSKDVAESLMNDLSDREKQLLQRRLGNRKAKENSHDKDW